MKRVLGWVALVMGVAILAGVGYGLLAGQAQGPEVNALSGLLVALAMIYCGTRWVRGEQIAQSSPESDVPSASEIPHASQPAPLSPLDRLRTFDLNRLNWLGWLLLACTFGLVVVGAILLGSFLDIKPAGHAWVPKAMAVPLLLLPIGFFFGVRWLMGKMGITIYRQ